VREVGDPRGQSEKTTPENERAEEEAATRPAKKLQLGNRYRIEGVLQTLSEQPKAGRELPELTPGLPSFPVGNYLLFYLPLPGGIDLVRVLSGYVDIGSDGFET
jgi:plasmid stabilization system protein ParE